MILGIFLALGDSFEDMSRSGQSERFLKYYVKPYSEKFNYVYIFSYGQFRPQKLPKNVTVLTNNYNLHRYLFCLIIPFKFYREILQCDIIRVFHLSGVIPAIITKLLFRKKYIFNFAYDYQTDALLGGKYLQSIFYRLLKPLALLTARRVLIANKYFLARINNPKSRYLPNGVDVQQFKPMKFKDKKRGIRILSIGRLEPQKNYSELIKALANLKISLILIGSGSLKKELISLATDLRVNLEITDKLENDKLPKYYNMADIFVLPSLTEGHPKVLIEAMACGKAVVGSNVGGIPDLISNNKTGLLCRTDRGSIRKAVIKLLNNKSFSKKVAHNARQFVLDNCDLSKIMQEEIKILQSA